MCNLKTFNIRCNFSNVIINNKVFCIKIRMKFINSLQKKVPHEGTYLYVDDM